MAQLKPGFKVVLIMVAVIAAFFVIKAVVPSSSSSGSSSTSGLGDIFGGKPTINIGVNTYAGFAPIVWINGGLRPNDESILTKEYGIRANIIIQDDFVAGRNAFLNGDIDLIYCTTDVLAVEMGEGSAMNSAKYVMMLNRSQGADAMVVTKNIRTVADLKGKKIAVAEGTASHTLLLNVLETNGISQHDVTLVKVDNGGAAADTFKAGQVDACVTWAPDDQACVDAIPGSRVLVSTKHAKDLVTDGLVGKAEWLDKNHDNVKKLISAILYANSTLNQNPSAVKEAAKIFAKAFGTDPEFAELGCGNIWFATLGDEENFFGMTSDYMGMKAEEIYSKMARTYASLGLTKSPLGWRKVSDMSFIEELSSEGTVQGNQAPQPAVKFSAVTSEVREKQAISNKKLTINFPVNGDILDNDARALIDREFVPIAKQFNNARVRIEGNTDNTGNRAYNESLSSRRAQAVANYLINDYGFDPNRFIIVGNGPKNAIRDGVQGSNINYRTTDFMLVTE